MECTKTNEAPDLMSAQPHSGSVCNVFRIVLVFVVTAAVERCAQFIDSRGKISILVVLINNCVALEKIIHICNGGESVSNYVSSKRGNNSVNRKTDGEMELQICFSNIFRLLHILLIRTCNFVNVNYISVSEEQIFYTFLLPNKLLQLFLRSLESIC